MNQTCHRCGAIFLLLVPCKFVVAGSWAGNYGPLSGAAPGHSTEVDMWVWTLTASASVSTERLPGQSSCGRAAITAPSYAGSQLICNEAIIRGITREKRSPASIYSLGHGPAGTVKADYWVRGGKYCDDWWQWQWDFSGNIPTIKPWIRIPVNTQTAER